MSAPTAKELLAQADRLMRHRTPEELPVLTDLVIEEIEIPSLSDRMDDVIPTHSRPVGTTSDGRDTQTPVLSAREQFNEQLLAKMEELQHSVFSQVMQKLEISASGSLKAHLRQTLEPALIGIARDLAEQVAEDTATQVRQVVSDAVDAEIARLRAQFAKKRP